MPLKLRNHNISIYDNSFVEKAVESRMAVIGCKTIEKYQELIDGTSSEEDALFSSLHIHFSEFFRNPLTFAVLEQIVLPRLIRQARSEGRREIRIWSAGCAAGQEPYSVAILLDEMLNGNDKSIDYRIFATDACETQIARARKGRYTEESFGGMTLKRFNSWFSRSGAEYVVNSRLTQRIDFSVFDLLDNRLSCPSASIFGGFDIVLCCNMLFYYKPEIRKGILNKLAHCLGRGGYLVTGEAERGFVLENGYDEVVLQAGVFGIK